MKRGKYIIFGVLIIIIIIATCKLTREKEEESISPIPVTLQEVVIKDHIYQVRGAGILKRKNQIRLSFKTGGIVGKVLVEEGAHVQKGDVLAQLDLSEIESQVKKAISGKNKAQRDLKRVRGLYEDKAATLEQLQNCQTAFEIASSNLEIARFNQTHSIIKAATDGRILRKFVQEGEMISPGMPVFLFGSAEQNFVLDMSVSDSQVVKIQYGDEATLRFDPYPDRQFKASVSQIAEMADTLTGTFKIELRIEEDNQLLRSGFIGKGYITTSFTQKYLIIPIESLVQANEDSGYVFLLLGENEIKKLKVKIKEIFNDTVAVTGDLKAGDRIICEGAEYLKPDSRIKVVSRGTE